MNKFLFSCGAALLGVTVCFSRLAAAEYRRLEGLQVYVGPLFGRTSLGGDFDGQRGFIARDLSEVGIVPEFNSATAFGGEIGLRNRVARSIDLGLEMSYMHSKHPATWAGIDVMDGKLNVLSFNLRSFFLTDKPIQPSILLGVNLPRLTLPDGRSRTPFVTTEEAVYSGIGLNVGAGVSFFLHPRVSIDVQGIYQHETFNELNDQKLDDSLVSNNMNFMIGLTFYLFGSDQAVTPESSSVPQLKSPGKPLTKEESGGVL